MLRFLLLVLLFNNACPKSKLEEELRNDIALSMHNRIYNSNVPHLVYKNKVETVLWLEKMSIKLSNWIKDDFLRKRYLTIIQYEALRAGLDPQLILSIITIESNFNKYAISTKGALGFMQVMPFWLKSLNAGDKNLFDVATNVRFGCTILRYYLLKEKGNIRTALKRYHGSLEDEIYPEKVFYTYNTYWKKN